MDIPNLNTDTRLCHCLHKGSTIYTVNRNYSFFELVSRFWPFSFIANANFICKLPASYINNLLIITSIFSHLSNDESSFELEIWWWVKMGQRWVNINFKVKATIWLLLSVARRIFYFSLDHRSMKCISIWATFPDVFRHNGDNSQLPMVAPIRMPHSDLFDHYTFRRTLQQYLPVPDVYYNKNLAYHEHEVEKI